MRKEPQEILRFDLRVNSKLAKENLKVVRAMVLTTCSGKVKLDRREPSFPTTKSCQRVSLLVIVLMKKRTLDQELHRKEFRFVLKTI